MNEVETILSEIEARLTLVGDTPNSVDVPRLLGALRRCISQRDSCLMVYAAPDAEEKIAQKDQELALILKGQAE